MSHKIGEKVYDNIFIGGAEVVQDEAWLRKNKIGLIVKCESDTDIVHPSIPTFHFPLIDTIIHPNARKPVMASIEKLTDMIKAVASSDMGILIHCRAGQNRSALVIGTFLCKHRGLGYEEIKSLLDAANKKRGTVALWNISFRAMLKDFCDS